MEYRSKLDLTENTIRNISFKNSQEQERIRALRLALGRIKNGRVPDNSDKLSDKYINTSLKHQLSQKSIVDDLITTWEKLSENERKTFSEKLKTKKSLFQAYDLVKEFNNEKFKINTKRNNKK